MTSRTLVCIIGNLRGGKLPFNTLKETILNHDCDLALCIGRDHDINNMCWKHEAKYIWEFDEPEDWGSIYDMVGTNWKNKIEGVHTGLWGGIHDYPGSGAIIFSFRYLLKLKLLELQLTDKYDFFIVTRSDHSYSNFHEIEQINKYDHIHIPHGEDWFGITDRHSIVPSKFIIPFLSIIEYINDVFVKHPYNPEQMLNQFYNYMNFKIKRYKRNVYTVGRNNEQTKWGKISNTVVVNEYFSKYEAEYHECMKNYPKSFESSLLLKFSNIDHNFNNFIKFNNIEYSTQLLHSKTIFDTYIELLNRWPDPHGFSSYYNHLQNNKSKRWLKQQIMSSEEYSIINAIPHAFKPHAYSNINIVTFASHGQFITKQQNISNIFMNKGYNVHNWTSDTLNLYGYLDRITNLLNDCSLVHADDERVKRAMFYMWKPVVIYETIKKIKEGEFLIYTDLDRCYNYDYDLEVEQFTEIVRLLFGGVFVIFGLFTNKEHSKRRVFDEMQCHSEEYLNHKQAAATWLVFQKNSRSIGIIEDWMYWCLHESLIISANPGPHPELKCFKRNSHDQAILTNLLIRKSKSDCLLRLPSIVDFEPLTWEKNMKATMDLYNNKYLSMIVSFYNEDLGWLENYYMKKYVYCKNIDNLKSNYIQLRNCGRDSHTFLHHIVHNYDNLTEVVVFTPGSVSTEAWGGLKLRKFRYVIDNLYKVFTHGIVCMPHEDGVDKVHFDYNFTISEWKGTDSKNCNNQNSSLILAKTRPFGKWYQENIDNNIDKIKKVGICYNNIFATTKFQIQKYPKTFYENLLLQLQIGENLEVIHYVERIWLSLYKY